MDIIAAICCGIVGILIGFGLQRKWEELCELLDFASETDNDTPVPHYDFDDIMERIAELEETIENKVDEVIVAIDDQS